ncbi:MULTISPECIES: phosphate ABC transporter permease subunit PstC [Desulfobacula]|uniref:Phosphate transport system permease protein n=1 Tax=Desulfobacula toluolica (strain DSM 7467 / Tol2) TaxID=651182 RepID=K0NKR1_DESTT|nr:MULTISPECIES: phosphate ABC transporter permease subunit PstC [Desulfobacula]CCK81370.1 PstC2: phosphate transport system, permease protein [Desulfobacula toluolica Tol2]
MTPLHLLITLLLLSMIGYYLGKKRSFFVVKESGGPKFLHSRPGYYGALTALWCGIPAVLVFSFWLAFEPTLIAQMVLSHLPVEIKSLPKDQLTLTMNDIKNLVNGNIVSIEVNPAIQKASEHYQHLQFVSHAALTVIAIVIAIAGLVYVQKLITPELRARNHVEKVLKWVLIACSTIAIFTTIGIVLSVLYEAIRFFKIIPITQFLFGLEWSPQMAIRSDQVGSSGAFGAIPVFAGTLLISAIAMFVAVPVGLMSAIYLSEYANKKFRAVAKPLLEILAGIPTVVYGFFAALVVAPAIRNAGAAAGLDVSSESALAAGLVMGVMIIPFVSSLSDDVINAVPQSLRDGAYGLGSTQSETIRQVILPAALPGIVGGVLLAVSRAIGETMIVVMAAGLSANLTMNPLKTVTTVTVQIVTLLVGDQEFDSPKTLAAFALGLMLFVTTLILNVIALIVVRKYREQYE